MRNLFIVTSGARRRTAFRYGTSLDAAFDALVETYCPKDVYDPTLIPDGRHRVWVRSRVDVPNSRRSEVRVVAEYLFDAKDGVVKEFTPAIEPLVDPDDIDWNA